MCSKTLQPSEIRLNSFEREYVVCGDDWEERIPKERKKQLDEDYQLIEDEHFLFMDSHGVNVKLAVFQRKSDEKMFAFAWGSSSEEWFFGEGFGERIHEYLPVFEVQRKEVTTYVYTDAEGEDLSNYEIHGP